MVSELAKIMKKYKAFMEGVRDFLFFNYPSKLPIEKYKVYGTAFTEVGDVLREAMLEIDEDLMRQSRNTESQ